MTQGLSSVPMPLKVVFKVRSKYAEEVIEREWDGAENMSMLSLKGLGRCRPRWEWMCDLW